MQKGGHGFCALSNRSLGRELLTPDELAQLDTHMCIYTLRGVLPFKSEKMDVPKIRGNYVYKRSEIIPKPSRIHNLSKENAFAPSDMAELERDDEYELDFTELTNTAVQVNDDTLSELSIEGLDE